jgi:hypothetical protein
MLDKTERVFTIVLPSRDVTLRCVESMTMKVAGRGTYNRIARHKSRHSEKCCLMPLLDTGQFERGSSDFPWRDHLPGRLRETFYEVGLDTFRGSRLPRPRARGKSGPSRIGAGSRGADRESSGR